MNRTKFAFDRFEIDTQKRLLLRDGQPVQLTSKAFDLLLALIESGGREITKDELMERVWANQIVEDANLTVTMSHIRKALGERAGEHRFIVTIPGRGYRFVGDLQPQEEFIIEQLTISQITIEQDDDVTTRLRDDETEFSQSLSRTVTQSHSLAVIQSGNRRLAYILSGAFVLALLLIGGFAVWRYKLSQKTGAVIPFSNATIKQLTTKGKVHNVAISPDGKFYAYTVYERGEYKNSLWLGQTDGSYEIQLRPPDDGNMIRGLAFSPDGKTLYFSLERTEESNGGLFKMSVLGGVSEKLSDNVSSWFALSPDGKQIAFFRQSKEQEASTALVIANLDGTGEREVATRPRDKNFSSSSPAWSPDGLMLAVGAVNDSAKPSEEIFVVRVADGHIEQLTATEWFRFSSLIWRRDGRGLIANTTLRDEAKLRHLWHIDYPTGKVSRISQDTDSYSWALSLSADGNSLLALGLHRESNIWIAQSDDFSQARQITFSAINGFYGWNGFDWTREGHIVFSAGVENSIAIHSMDADGNNIRQITSAGFFDRKPSVTADGSFILFESNRGGASEIWRVKSDGGDLRQLTTGGGNSAPHITPDGKWVVYISTREGKNFLSRISIEGGAETQITDKASSADPRVSPDGKFIACRYKQDDKSPTQLAIISIAEGKLVKLFDVPRTAYFNQSIRWTHDGKAVCYRDGVNGIWKQDLQGGPPKRLEDLPEEKLYNFGWSADGKLFAFVRGREITDAVLIKNFN